uniref:NADH-ubiquinone oxidoreductase chain 4L n=1 Tax=Fornicia albalata TaxID=1911503 RepID=A0A6F8ASY0_9HYME|nr:NADH dehydrogenase subunit 4L [Fornicia albalata]
MYMLNLYLNLSVFMILIFLFMFSNYYKKHLLVGLMSLEFIMLTIFMFIYMYLMYLELSIYFMCLFLVIMVCESILGLTILVYMVRKIGNDYVKMLNLLII